MNRLLTLRLTAPMLIVGVLLLAGCLGAAWYVQEFQRNVSEILALNVASMRAAEELEITLREIRNQLDGYLLSGDAKHLETLPELRRETAYWLGEAEKLATTEREQVLMGEARRGCEHFFKELDEVIRQPPEGAARREMHRLIDKVLTDEILDPAHAYLDWNEEEATKAVARNQAAGNWTVLALLLLGIVGPLGGLLTGLGIAQRINHTLVRLSLPISDATGRLNEVVEPITLAPGWDLEDLEQVLNRMAGQIGEVIERMEQSQQEALRAEQLAFLGQLAAGVAHELRNPLMSMKILVQASSVRGGAGLSGRGLAVLEEEITRLERLTETLLDYARPVVLEKRPFDVGGLLEDTTALLSGRAGRRDVLLECDLPTCPVWLEGDASQVRQVLLNLLLNAVDAVPNGGQVCAQVRVVQETSGPTSTVEITVQDTGPGLPTDLRRDIFAPFVSTKPTGLGLGLSICKRIAEAHGGEILAANGEQGGAIFQVRLPGLCASLDRLASAA